MPWILIFAGIGVIGLITLVSYGIWLAHKTSDVMSEVRVLNDRTGQLLDLAGQIKPTQSVLQTVGPSVTSSSSPTDSFPPADPPPAT